MMKKLFLLLTVSILCYALLISPALRRVSAADCFRTSMGFVPLNDLGAGTYSGTQGGLYPAGGNLRPPAHETAGVLQALAVRPLDANGQPSPTGKVVFLSIGMSNTTQEFSTFKLLADTEPRRNPNMVVVDGAQGSQGAAFWTDPNAQAWTVVANRLNAAGVTPQQVQTVWLKQQLNADAIVNFPADAQSLRDALRDIVRNAKSKYPNLRVLYLTSRSYGGYGSVTRGTGAYRSGFAVKWLIEDQLNGDSRLAFTGTNPPAPWLAWGPYIYADGLNPRSDGLTYACSDFNDDGIHPSAASGRPKIANLLLDFLKSDSTARLWFLRFRGNSSDFDGDGKSDTAVFRPSDSVWYLQNSLSGFSAVQFGIATDKLAPADFDGDGKTDIAVFRDGFWYWLNSSNNSFSGVQFGQVGDVPVPADYSGDGRAELAVFRGGFWYTLNLANNQFQGFQWGVASDKPVAADYDGDGKADIAVVRQSGGLSSWYILGTSQGFYGLQFGNDTDKLVPADYDGDGKTDVAVFRGGFWYILRSAQGFYGLQFGASNDIPVAADYDGDGKADVAVFRDGFWYMLRSQQGFGAVQFGTTNDKPIPAAFVP